MVGALVVFAVVLGAVWWTTASDDSSDSDAGQATSSSAPPLDEPTRDERTTALLHDLSVSWASRDQRGFVAAAGDSAASREWAGQVYDTLDDLGVGWIDLRYISTDSESAADPLGFTADVEVRWEIAAGPERQVYRTAPVDVPLRFAYENDDVALVGLASPTTDPVPVWLAGPVAVESASGGTCVGVPDDVDLDTCLHLVDVAAKDLNRVVPDDGIAGRPVVVLVPAADTTAAMLLGQDVDNLGQIAAVTTTIDGSSSSRAPAEIVVNPAVFDDLRHKAAQLVISHEVTHAATGVTAAAMPLWVAEGFADYVALASGRIPVQRAASQILGYVRKHDVPGRIPTENQFAADRHGLGRTYESAWLIFRMLGAYYGDDAVVSFYDEVRTGTPVEQALIDTVGLNVDELTTAWQDYLNDLAHGAY